MTPNSSLFFRPTGNFSSMLPGLALLSLALLFIAGIAFIIWYWQQQNLQMMERRRFQVRADRLKLTRRERHFVQIMAQKAQQKSFSRLLSNQTLFEKAAYQLPNRKDASQRLLLESLREKIFGKTLANSAQGCSTTSLIPGSILHLKNVDIEAPILKGKLLDNDDMGLIVVLQSARRNPPRVHPQDRIAVVSHFPDQKQVKFFTWVKSIIPGPSNMVVLAHAKYQDTLEYRMPVAQKNAMQQLTASTQAAQP